MRENSGRERVFITGGPIEMQVFHTLGGVDLHFVCCIHDGRDAVKTLYQIGTLY